MENALNEDLPVGIYHTKDKIKNLKFRVKVRKIANACFSEKDSFVFGNPNELELVNMMKAPSAKSEQEFCWQEKIERNKEGNLTDNTARNNSKSENLIISLFSYVDADILSPEWKGIPHTVPASSLSYIEKQMLQLKPKTRLQTHEMKTWQKPLFSGAKKLVKEKSNKKDETFPVGQSMIIMAALYFEDSSSIEEIQLCSLQFDDHGTLIMVPDFTKQKSYVFLNSRSETFEYEIENASPELSNSAIEREKYLKQKIAEYKKKVKDVNFGPEFKPDAPNETLLSLNCEIVSAKNFPFSNLYIHYTVLMPNGWNSDSSMEGVTETCECKTKSKVSFCPEENIAYFGYLFSLDFTASTDESDLVDKSVKIIFEITSVDFWGNFRNIGYGFADLLLVPGSEVINVYTWRIEPTDLKSKLQYFFIGGMPTLTDLSYVIKPQDAKDAQLSKYGFRTITSGSVELKYSIIRQNCKTVIT
ncbi:tectonic-like complex member MKS1 isoform X1 [Parasteatoda tepidariorum]|uniref:tectonic-like complex member MKS1 isoform X1 n=2 Tax=Parasteatoda tepidariorum TaxID=114398 RepID=UPI0039BC62A3